MNPNEIVLDTLFMDNDVLTFTDDEIGDDHIMTSVETPMHEAAFDLTDSEKVNDQEEVKNYIKALNESVKELTSEIELKNKLKTSKSDTVTLTQITLLIIY